MREIIVLIDANFILLPFQLKIDYIEEIQNKLQGKVKFIVFKQVIDELKAKAKRKNKSNKFLLLLNSGLSYLETHKKSHDILFDSAIKAPEETSDEFLIWNCIKLKDKGMLVYLATNDKELKRKAKTRKINLIFVRQKKKISIERA